MIQGPTRTGVLLVNLGTPDSTSTGDVRRYLRQFLMDGRVIDFPFIARFALVQGIIAPFRSPKSAAEYRKVWTEAGSPLKVYGLKIEEMLQKELGPEYEVVLGMRYQNPSIDVALRKLQKPEINRIVVIPLFPQYASATTGSVQQDVMRIVANWQLIPEMVFVSQFFDHPGFIHGFATKAAEMMKHHDYDHVVFTYHGLPERQIRKGDLTGTCLTKPGNCCDTLNAGNHLCYRAQCFATSRLLAQALNLPKEKYTICFQSRLGKDIWLQPYTEDVVKELAAKGIRRVLTFSPSFVSDCLETTIEVGETYKEQFEEAGGEHWELVPSLNDDQNWVETLKAIVHTYDRSVATRVLAPAEAALID